MLWLFFRQRKRILDTYNALFNAGRETDESEPDTRESKSFGEHWGWFATIYQLSKSGILNITKTKNIVDLNFVFVLNYLAIDKDWNKEEEKALKQARNTRKII